MFYTKSSNNKKYNNSINNNVCIYYVSNAE